MLFKQIEIDNWLMAPGLSLFSFLVSPIPDERLAPASRASTIASTETGCGTFHHISFRVAVRVAGASISINHPISLRVEVRSKFESKLKSTLNAAKLVRLSLDQKS